VIETSPSRQQVECRLRRSSRAKRLRLVVRPGLIELVAPVGMPESRAMKFLDEHREWAESKAREFFRKAETAPALPSFCRRTTLPWQGRDLLLLIREEDTRRVTVQVDEAVHITLPRDLGEDRDRAALRAWQLWMCRWLSQRVKGLARDIGNAEGLVARQVRIKVMKTRWGSCGPRNDININWLLALVPGPVLTYVVIHEVCHIRERNHSPAFWSLVAKHCPDYLRHRHWLKTHGPALMHNFSIIP